MVKRYIEQFRLGLSFCQQYLATLVAPQFTPVSERLGGSYFRTSVASRLASLFYKLNRFLRYYQIQCVCDGSICLTCQILFLTISFLVFAVQDKNMALVMKLIQDFCPDPNFLTPATANNNILTPQAICF